MRVGEGARGVKDMEEVCLVISALPRRLSPTCHGLTRDAIIGGKFRSPCGMCQACCQRQLMCGLLAPPKGVTGAYVCTKLLHTSVKKRDDLGFSARV